MNWKTEILNHLWQSTAFAGATALATLALRRNSPRLRFWLWLAASVKFLIPFSLLVATGARVKLPPDSPSFHAMAVQQMSFVFSPVVTPVRSRLQWEWLALAIWAVGVLVLFVRWVRNWQRVKTAGTLEPGVYGVFRPVLFLPEGLSEVLTEGQLQAVLAHEARHIECFDNLTAALHMVVEMLFWFHPLVWWIGARMMDERERDCDEAVLLRGNRAGDYARSIVHVCRIYAESPLACVSGIGGSDLKKRIREIMTWRGSVPVTRTGKALLAAAALVIVSLPFVLGVVRAQSLPPEPTLGYEAVSIHKSDPGATGVRIGRGPQGGWRTENTTATLLIATAYHVPEYEIIGAPVWASKQGYDIVFTPDKSEPALGSSPSLKEVDGSMHRNSQRMQAILRDRFGLVLRPETRELPVYRLTQAKGGHKLRPHNPQGTNSGINLSPGRVATEQRLTGVDISVAHLIDVLSGVLRRPVVDETRLDGQYDFTMYYTPDLETAQNDAASVAGSLFTAITDQLGMKLEAAKGPVQVYVVEKLEQPSDN
jgi:bla regulator protein blaR1